MAKHRNGRAFILILIILAIILFLFAMMPVSCDDVSKRNARRMACMNNLSQIGKAAKMYEIDHTNKIPNIESLTNYLEAPKCFICPGSGHKEGALSNMSNWTDYVLVPGVTTSSPPNKAMIYCPPKNHNGKGGCILFVDGSVSWFDEKDFWKQLK